MKEDLALCKYVELKLAHVSSYKSAVGETSCSTSSCYSCGDSCSDGGGGE